MPPEVAELCLRCLAKQPEDRPAAAEVADGAGALVGLQPIIAPSVGCRPSPHPCPRRRTRPLRHRRAGCEPACGSAAAWSADLLAGGGSAASAVLAGRHRLQAAVATLILARHVGLVWSSTREPVDVGTAQAAAAGPRRARSCRTARGCKVRYRVKRDSGTDFGAQVTIVNTGEHVLVGVAAGVRLPGRAAADRVTEAAHPEGPQAGAARQERHRTAPGPLGDGDA